MSLNAIFGLQLWRERAAARWLARMGNAGDAFDRAAFERWRANPANARAFDEAAGHWGRDLPIAATRHARDRNGTAQDSAPTVWPRRAALAAVAAAVIATVVGVGHRPVGLPGPSRSAPPTLGARQVATGPGDARAFRLSDGSIAALGAGSVLEIAFTDSVRTLTLVRGQARFMVAHEIDRPFRVRAGQSLITAHGTIFDVRLAARDVRVVLLRGAIDVERLDGGRRTGERRQLAPGEGLTVPAAGPIGPVEPAATHDAAGAQAMLSFDRTPLAEAIAAFNQRNIRQIALDAPARGGDTASGAFAANDPDGFARMLAVMFDLTVSRRSDGDLVLTARR